jgi:hypothetical protein
MNSLSPRWGIAWPTMARRKQAYRITYPNGKIYVGMDPTGTLLYVGSPSAREQIAADLEAHRLDLTPLPRPRVHQLLGPLRCTASSPESRPDASRSTPPGAAAARLPDRRRSRPPSAPSGRGPSAPRHASCALANRSRYGATTNPGYVTGRSWRPAAASAPCRRSRQPSVLRFRHPACGR